MLWSYTPPLCTAGYSYQLHLCCPSLPTSSCLPLSLLPQVSGPRFQVLHVFMDAFQGSYRTHSRDMRYFSAFYLFLQILILAQPQIFPYIMFFTSGILSLASAAAVTIFQPYKVKSHNTMDSVMMLLMGVYFLSYLIWNYCTYTMDLMQNSLEHTYFLKGGAGDLIFTTCDCYGLNNVVFNFGAHS